MCLWVVSWVGPSAKRTQSAGSSLWRNVPVMLRFENSLRELQALFWGNKKLTLQIEVNWPNFVITVALTNASRPVCSIVTSLELDCALPATVQRSWIRPYQRRRSRRLQTINPESSQPENGIPIRAPLSEIPALLRKRPVVVVVVLVVLVSFFCAVATAAGWVWFMTLHHSSFSGTCRSCVHSVCDNVKGYSRLCIVSRVLAQVWFCPGKPPKGTSFTSWSE